MYLHTDPHLRRTRPLPPEPGEPDQKDDVKGFTLLDRYGSSRPDPEAQDLIPSLTPPSPGLVSISLEIRKLLQKATALTIRRGGSGLWGWIDRWHTLAFADTGSDHNIILENYAQKCGISIDRSPPHALPIVPLPQKGKYLKIIGITTVSWAFEDNASQSHRLVLYVASNCVHDVIVGKDFLEQTKSLTDYRHRLVSMPPRLPRRNILSVNSIGASHQKLRMFARQELGDEFEAYCLPDTGSEGEVISETFARRHKLRLERSDTTFEFADGTMDDSLGRVRLDMFFEDAPEKQISRYLEVMRDGQHDIILSHQFVFEHNLFSRKVQRLINATGRLGLNAITFFQGWRQDADPAVSQRNNEHQALAMEKRNENVTRQSNGPSHASSNAIPAPAVQGSSQPVASTQASAPASHQRGHHSPWWRRLFC